MAKLPERAADAAHTPLDGVFHVVFYIFSLINTLVVAGARRLLYVLPAGSEASVIYAAAGGGGDTDAAKSSSPASSAPS